MNLLIENLGPTVIPISSSNEPWEMTVRQDVGVRPSKDVGFTGRRWLIGRKVGFFARAWRELRAVVAVFGSRKASEDYESQEVNRALIVRITNEGDLPVAVSIDTLAHMTALLPKEKMVYPASNWIQLEEIEDQRSEEWDGDL